MAPRLTSNLAAVPLERKMKVNKSDFVKIGIGVLVGVVLANKLRTLPGISALPSV